MSKALRRRRRRLASRMVSAALSLSFVSGVALAATPLVDDLRWSQESQQVISQMSSTIDRTDDPARKEALRAAQAYNLMLGGSGARTDNEELGGSNGGNADIATLATADGLAADDVAPVAYGDQLVWNGISALCWLEIPALSLTAPVYHGTSDDVLAQGVGHLDWSSLPVGGLSSRCVLAAHSGMEETRMFDGLETLEVGDLLVLHTLGDAYAYRVYASEVVLPEDVEARCAIEAGGDLCTLMTCTPYGINTHRLLVHAERVPYVAREAKAVPLRAYVNRRTAPVLGVGGVLGISSVGTLAVAHLRHRRRTSAQHRPGYHHRHHFA